ncbi:serine protease [Vibrio sp.]|nr:serine protease [Vibrio sp.]
MGIISKPSVQSLMIEMRFNETSLSTGTAFVVIGNSGPLLITNRHNLTGRHQETDEPLSKMASIPNNIVITHNKKNMYGDFIRVIEPILDKEENPLWIEHPVLGRQADFVALPLNELDDVDIYPYDLSNTGPEILLAPADIISVVGFPFSIQVGNSLAVWATGFIASEPNINYNELPIFLVDCRSRQGQSGSAVIAYRHGGAVPTAEGEVTIFDNPITKFLGIYSGRVNAESDLGFVWKASAIKQLVDVI